MRGTEGSGEEQDDSELEAFCITKVNNEAMGIVVGVQGGKVLQAVGGELCAGRCCGVYTSHGAWLHGGASAGRIVRCSGRG